MLGPSTTQPFGVGLVAVDDGIPVAAGAIRTQANHPQRMWCFIETAPLQRQRGIATDLYQQLVARAPEHTAFKTRSTAHDETTAAWLRSHGFGEIQRTRRIIIPTGAFQTPDVPVDELATGSVALSSLVADYYNATHSWDPANLSITQAQHLLLAPRTGAQQALITRQNSNLAGFAIAYPGPLPDVIELFVGHAPEAADPGADLRALLATANEHRSLAIELDDSTTVLNGLLTPLIEAGTALTEHETITWATDATDHA